MDKYVSELFRAKALAKVLEEKIETLKGLVADELLSLGTYGYTTSEGVISHRSGSVKYKFDEGKVLGLPKDDPDKIAYERIVSNQKYHTLKTTSQSWVVSPAPSTVERAVKELEELLSTKEEV